MERAQERVKLGLNWIFKEMSEGGIFLTNSDYQLLSDSAMWNQFVIMKAQALCGIIQLYNIGTGIYL